MVSRYPPKWDETINPFFKTQVPLHSFITDNISLLLKVWRGMAWVTDGIEDEEEETRSSDKMEQGIDSYGTMAVKKLSVIPEASSFHIETVGILFNMSFYNHFLPLQPSIVSGSSIRSQ
ncbi:unnamed protein product [Haemonchus placei]|uniref:Bestrophin homolog n=1 Tax=Haemonchus placei TaxID=6290 RepID=A0A0N4X7F1_HAEPC|nr:unnamed protein product [Haemonchus placei]